MVYQVSKKKDLSFVEEAVFKIAGEKGVDLFRIADGKITIEDAAQVLKISEEEVREILNKLEGKFLHTEYESEEEKISKRKEEMAPIDVPIKISEGSFTLRTEFTLQFGPSGKKFFDLIDGEKDLVQLSIDSEITLAYADDIVWWLSQKGILRFRSLPRDEIKKRYGNVGLSLYERYGRDGVYLYLLIEKYADYTLAIKASGLDLLLAADICESTHRLISPPFQFDKKYLIEALSA